MKPKVQSNRSGSSLHAVCEWTEWFREGLHQLLVFTTLVPHIQELAVAVQAIDHTSH